MVKIEDIGQRINRLREYVKGLTGASPKNNTGYRQLIVKIDGTCHNKIMEENKLYISPNYTKLEKKIAEWRESKLYRAYGEKEILYNKNNQGYQINVTQKIKNPKNT